MSPTQPSNLAPLLCTELNYWHVVFLVTQPRNLSILILQASFSPEKTSYQNPWKFHQMYLLLFTPDATVPSLPWTMPDFHHGSTCQLALWPLRSILHTHINSCLSEFQIWTASRPQKSSTAFGHEDPSPGHSAQGPPRSYSQPYLQHLMPSPPDLLHMQAFVYTLPST